MSLHQRLIDSIETRKSHVCVGLDSRYDRLPTFATDNNSIAEAILAFNIAIVETTHKLAAAYKSNVAFYAGFGAEGLKGLQLTNEYIKKHYPDIPLLADCKRSEMGESVMMIKQEIFDWLQFDCVMVTPWFGSDTIKDYLDVDGKGVCVYVHDSNPSAPEVQEVKLENGQYLYEYVTELVTTQWNQGDNVFIEAGATYPEAFKKCRKIAGDDLPMLTAGVGIQGGNAEDLVGNFGTNGTRLLVNSSRGIIFAGQASDSEKVYCQKVLEAAQSLRDILWSLSQQ